MGILHVMDTRLGNLLGLAILLSHSPRFLTLVDRWLGGGSNGLVCVCVCLARVYVSVATNKPYLHQRQFPYEEICLCRCRGSVLVFAETDGDVCSDGRGFSIEGRVHNHIHNDLELLA